MSQYGYHETQLIDSEFFESRRQVGEDFVIKLVEVFDQEAPKLINKIKSVHTEGDYRHLAELSHKLKGMCLNVGAVRLSEAGRTIEELILDDDTVRITPVVEELDDLFQLTLNEMKQIV